MSRITTNWPPLPRGYFAIGAERMSKSLNLGNLMRSAHAFGASFTFTVGATYQALEARADTSKGQWHLPHYNWVKSEDMALPQGCRFSISDSPWTGSSMSFTQTELAPPRLPAVATEPSFFRSSSGRMGTGLFSGLTPSYAALHVVQ